MANTLNSSFTTKIGVALVAFFFSFLSLPFSGAQAQSIAPDDSGAVTYEEFFYRGEVTAIFEEGNDEGGYHQKIEVNFLEGPLKEETIILEYSNSGITPSGKLNVGDHVVVLETVMNGDTQYALFEPYRLSRMMRLLAVFIGVVILIAGKRGVTALLGLAVTVLILVKWMIPQIIAGASPMTVSWIGAIAIAGCSLYLAHGFNKRTSLALFSTLIMLHLSLALGWGAVEIGKLFGMGSHEAASLTFGNFAGIDLRGLLLGAIVIGCLGVLDDVTTAQTATVEELLKANGKFTFKELYARALSVGKEHITSLVNTLLLAYIGVAFPVILLIADSANPFWVILNNEFVAEELVRTLVGSTTLVLAVPVSTALAAYFYTAKKY